MGFFDALFGTKKEPEAPKKKKKAVSVADQPVRDVGQNAEQGINPEILAAITASINCVMDDNTDAEIIAAIAAAIHHARTGGALAIKFKRSNNAWAATGRQKVMDSRQFA